MTFRELTNTKKPDKEERYNMTSVKKIAMIAEEPSSSFKTTGKDEKWKTRYHSRTLGDNALPERQNPYNPLSVGVHDAVT